MYICIRVYIYIYVYASSTHNEIILVCFLILGFRFLVFLKVEGLVDAPLLLVNSLRDKNAKLKEIKAAVEQQKKELQELKLQDEQLRDLKLAKGLENLELDASASICP